MKPSTLTRRALPLLWLVSSVAIATPVFERALPAGPNVNAGAAGNAAPEGNRSNIKWAPSDPVTIFGDDFQLPFDTLIDAITVWMVAENPNTTDPSQELSSLRLFGGNDAVMELKAGSYTFAQVTYGNAQSYWNPNRAIFQPIFEVTFNGLNWAVLGGEVYDFAVEGIAVAGQDHLLSLHASNGCEFDPNFNACADAPGFSESPQDGPDGAFLEFAPTGRPDQYALLNAWYSHPDLDGLWDKSSDLNVRIATIPEPSTFALLGLGFAAIVYFRRRRQ